MPCSKLLFSPPPPRNDCNRAREVTDGPTEEQAEACTCDAGREVLVSYHQVPKQETRGHGPDKTSNEGGEYSARRARRSRTYSGLCVHSTPRRSPSIVILAHGPLLPDRLSCPRGESH